MLRGIYAAATGMDAATTAHETISRNLAHVSVPGFRRMLLPFASLEKGAQADDEEATDLRSQADSSGNAKVLGVKAGQAQIDFTPGPIQKTGAPLDVALAGDGFFVVQGPDGPLYTRNGSFQLDSTGKLVTADGLAVEGSSGAISLPPNVTPSHVQIAPDGTIRAGREEIGKLEIVSFDDPQRLSPVGATLFSAPDDVQSHAAEKTTVIQGSREQSNATAINELINLITAQRHYESSQRVISTIDRAMQRRLEAN
jgi:flagellar basal-body rod protein FlgF